MTALKELVSPCKAPLGEASQRQTKEPEPWLLAQNCSDPYSKL
jgi:hypothetical protein